MASRRTSATDPASSQRLSVCVLAGGRSSRMGRNKALLDCDGRSLLARAIDTAREAGASIGISGPAALYAHFGVPCWEDRYPGSGPLGAFATALEHSGASRMLMLACDLPFITSRFLRWLWDRSSGHQWTVPESAPGRLEPLCSIYSRALLPAITAAISRGEFKIDRALAGVERETLTLAELAANGFCPRLFVNINTIEEYERLLAGPATLPSPDPRDPS